MDYELIAKQLGFESYDELEMYYDLGYIKRGTFSVNKEECLKYIKFNGNDELLNKPRNEQLYHLMHMDIDLLEESQDDEPEFIEKYFLDLQYHIEKLKQIHEKQENKGRAR